MSDRRKNIVAIQRALKDQGRSVNAWAAEKGYAPRSVYTAIETWAGRTDRQPWGGISRSIMADLRADLGPELVPEVRREAA